MMSGWVPVRSGLLPEVNELVLVTCRTKSGMRSVNRAYVDEHGWWHGAGSMSGVTAWMTLPDPWDGDEDG